MQQLDLLASAPSLPVERISLPSVCHLRMVHLLTWEAPAPVQPNPQLLAVLTRGRRSVRAGKRQTDMSKRRQNFITGMSVYRMSEAERDARKAYEDEWMWRVGHD